MPLIRYGGRKWSAAGEDRKEEGGGRGLATKWVRAGHCPQRGEERGEAWLGVAVASMRWTRVANAL